MKELFAAMALAFPEIEGAAKDKANPHFRSKYADLGNVVEAIKPALTKHGLFFVQMTHEVDGGVCVETVVGHKSGEQMALGKLFVPASKQDAQGFGSALTYARRYSLMTAFGVAPEDDDGNAASKSPPTQPAHTSMENGKTVERTKLSGPHMTVAALKTACAEIRETCETAADKDSLDTYLDTQRETIVQVKRDKPDWWSNVDYGLDGTIMKAYQRIELEVEEHHIRQSSNLRLAG